VREPHCPLAPCSTCIFIDRPSPCLPSIRPCFPRDGGPRWGVLVVPDALPRGRFTLQCCPLPSRRPKGSASVDLTGRPAQQIMNDAGSLFASKTAREISSLLAQVVEAQTSREVNGLSSKALSGNAPALFEVVNELRNGLQSPPTTWAISCTTRPLSIDPHVPPRRITRKERAALFSAGTHLC